MGKPSVAKVNPWFLGKTLLTFWYGCQALPTQIEVIDFTQGRQGPWKSIENVHCREKPNGAVAYMYRPSNLKSKYVVSYRFPYMYALLFTRVACVLLKKNTQNLWCTYGKSSYMYMVLSCTRFPCTWCSHVHAVMDMLRVHERLPWTRFHVHSGSHLLFQ